MTRFMTRDRKWTVDGITLTTTPPSGDGSWGSPQHGDGEYLRASGERMVFYAGSARKDSEGKVRTADERHLAMWAELAAEGLFDLADLEEVVSITIPAGLEAQVQELVSTYHGEQVAA